MAEEIEKIIFGLELDGSAYIRGADSLIDSTKKLTAEQERANKALQTSQAILKQQSTYFQQTKAALDSYTGTNEKYRLQLTKDFTSAEKENQKLTEEVIKNQQAYEAATKAAQDFANASAKASNLQQQTTGGKIPTGPPPGTSSNITNQIARVLNVEDFAKQAQIIEQTKNEFDDLAVSVGLAEERMKQLNETDEEFQQLAPIVAKGKEAIQQYDNVTKSAAGSQVSLRTQLRQGREELVRLEQAGKGATKQYFELEKQVARLTDEFGDQQARIKILASDTKLLDFGKGAITAATSAFQAYTSIAILAGDENEELQKKTQQLFAAMQLLQSLEQLSNLTRREGVLATLAQSGAQTVYMAVVGASTGALRAFRLALLGTGIGAAIVLIGVLVSKYLDYTNAVKKAGAEQKVLDDIIKEGNQNAGKEIVDLKILYDATQNVALSTETRVTAAKKLQELYPEIFANFSKENILLGDAKTAYDKLTDSIYANARAAAGKVKLQDLTAKSLDIETGLQNAQDDFDRANLAFNLEIKQSIKDGADQMKDQNNQYITLTREGFTKIRDEKVKALKDDLADNKAQQDAIVRLVGAANLVDTVTGDKEKKTTEKKVREIENVYLAEKAKLDERLADVNRKEADNESKIRIEFAARLVKEELAIDKLQKEKKLTKPQAADLKAEAGQINTVELDKALSDFNKKTIDARQKLNDELRNLQDKNTLDQLNLIQDEFERRRQLIDFNEQRELDGAKENTRKRLEGLDLQRLLVGEQAYQTAKAIIVTEGAQAILNIETENANKRKDLGADILQGVLDAYDAAIKNANLIRDEDAAKQVQALNAQFLSGKISYQKYQDEIKKIKDAHDREEADRTLDTDKNKLAELDRQLAAEKNKYSAHYKELKKQRDELASSIAKRAAEPLPPDPNEERVNNVAKYADAIGAVAASVIKFWQEANAAESAALDRSISLQEKRVDAAQRIADRGNAQYLKAEEDRLTELNVKRENAARKQLGIDAALQASQILVGITGAIAKIATPGIGIAETIGSIAIIIGALATGYGLVKSLQGNQPKLAKGTTELKRRGEPAGIDTIPAWLNEGEAVIPTEKNKKYKKTVEAIYHGKVPADVMNEFVENYVRNNTKNKKIENKTESTYQNFVNNVSKIPTKVLNEFISNYEKKEVRKYFKGTTDVKATGETSIPGWFSDSAPVKAKNFTETKEAIYQGKIPAEVINEFAEKYVKEVRDKKDTQELTSIVKKVLIEKGVKDVSDKEINSFISEVVNKKVTSDISETKAFTIAEKLVNLVDHKLNKTENISVDDVIKYSHITNKVFRENKELVEQKNISSLAAKVYNQLQETRDIKNVTTDKIISFIDTYTRKIERSNVETKEKYQGIYESKEFIESKIVSGNAAPIKTAKEIISNVIENKIKRDTFAANVAHVPDKVLTNFINRYEERKLSTELVNRTKEDVNYLPVSSLYKPVIKAVFNGTVPADKLNSFVNNYHSIKAVPIPDYKRIKESAEIKINSDGRMSVLLSEQNNLLKINNDLQMQILKKRGVHAELNFDKNGVSAMVTEFMEQSEINKRI